MDEGERASLYSDPVYPDRPPVPRVRFSAEGSIWSSWERFSRDVDQLRARLHEDVRVPAREVFELTASVFVFVDGLKASYRAFREGFERPSRAGRASRKTKNVDRLPAAVAQEVRTYRAAKRLSLRAAAEELAPKWGISESQIRRIEREHRSR